MNRFRNWLPIIVWLVAFIVLIVEDSSAGLLDGIVSSLLIGYFVAIGGLTIGEDIRNWLIKREQPTPVHESIEVNKFASHILSLMDRGCTNIRAQITFDEPVEKGGK